MICTFVRLCAGFLALFLLSPTTHAATPAISAGFGHVIALKADGTVSSWGSDSFGQLGVGRLLQSNTPLATSAIPGVVTIASGTQHALALRNDGSAWAWGSNSSGQLGDASTTNRSIPVQVKGLTGVIAIDAGDYHSVALKNDGSVWTWGMGSRLGNGASTALQTTPVQVSGLTGVIAVAAGDSHTIAVKSDGSVWSWGNNDYGQLGDGTVTQRLTPTQVSSLTGAVSVSAGGKYSVVVKSDGTVWAWGDNYFGELGDGTKTQRLTPVQVSGLSGVKTVSAGAWHTVAIKTDGSAWAWGDDSYGQIGDGATFTQRLTPVLLGGLGVVTSISASLDFTVAVKADGTVWSWGRNLNGRLGDGSTTDRPSPVQVAGLSGVSTVTAGGFFGVALKSDGSMWAWGQNNYGQLANASVTARTTPVQVSGLAGVVAISTGSSSSYAVKNDGSLWAWGYNLTSQLGDGTNIDRQLPVQVTGLTGVSAVAGGQFFTLALKSDGSVWAWGSDNFYGQLGNTPPNLSHPIPAQVAGMTGAIAVAAGYYHSVALKNDGSVWTWGRNSLGQLGDGSMIDRPSPMQVPGLTGVTAIAAGTNVTAALKSDGSVWIWGGFFNSLLSPVQVTGLSGVIALSTALNNTVAIKNDGSVWLVRVTAAPLSAVQVSELSSMAAITTTDSYTAAIRGDGTVLTWGHNPFGQLGDGTLADHYLPVVVLRENGAGKIETNDWFLDLNPGISKTIPADKIPPFLAVASQIGADINANIQYRASDIGQSGSVYVYALAPATLVKDAVLAPKHLGPKTNATGKDTPIACVLAQLNASGQLTAANIDALKAYTTGVFGSQGTAVEVLKGVPAANVQGAVFNIGYGASSAEMSRRGSNRSVATISATQTCQPQAPETGWWWNPGQDGRGYSIEARGNNLFMAGYLYDVSGRATWVVSGGPASLDGSLYTNTLYSFANGTSLNGSYHAPDRPGTAVGPVTLTFSDATHGTMIWPGGTLALERFNIAPPNATPLAYTPENGWWWNKDEDGRGYFMEFQKNAAFIAGYMYDTSGKPIWYVSNGNMANAQSYSNNWLEFANGQTMTGAWKAPMQLASPGAIGIQFKDSANATLTFPNGKQLPIERFRF